jgi:hypothetical protein
MDRVYYSQRIGRSPLANPDMNDVARVLALTVAEMWQRGYMQEWYGYHCVDAGNVDGRAAMPLPAHIEGETGWRWPWPPHDPLFHNGCGWHYGAFDPGPARALFRSRMNRTLTKYLGGSFWISENGQIEHTADDGLDQLIDAPLPTKEPDIVRRVEGAIAIFRNRGRTEEDLRLAVRELFDVLEKLRPQVKAEMLTADEGALFNIANNFTIRHLNEKQKGNYDSAIWHHWMFYVNLSTIHLITRLTARKAGEGQEVGAP